ncbi:hypothetical protein CV_0730 [Chromobacterium violaceum ATCC 12472]|uniref:Uncharacterized protein n=2 Tax=Chromobacterium violaceum TaxID=536 RepID=Q7P038_CHRVO|nr:hypothetical protein CV_0730 [Chromobacterium violaceum ATCC 12472]
MSRFQAPLPNSSLQHKHPVSDFTTTPRHRPQQDSAHATQTPHFMDTPDQDANGAAPRGGMLRGSIPELSKSPVHLLSAIVTLAADKLWDVMLLDMAKAMPLQEKTRFFLLSGLLLFSFIGLSAALTQLWVDKDSLGMALAKGVAMGILAGLPYSFGSTELGLLFIGWSGINELQKMDK